MPGLFTPLHLGNIKLSNRVIMAPMTRSRALADGSPSEIMATYYQQRASAGMIITEGVYPSEDGKGYCRTPGIANEAQKKAWKPVVDAVHSEGGKLAMQLMHCGRIAHADNKKAGSETIAPSAIRANGSMFTETGMKPFDMPRVIETHEIPLIIQQYCDAASRAMDIGFDGIEVHCTSGYLPAQFLATGTNQRQDDYGGNMENRCRFVIELMQALSTTIGSPHLGIRICPGNPFNDLQDEEPYATFAYLLKQLSPLGLAWLHGIKSPDKNIDTIKLAKNHFIGALIINDGFDALSGEAMIEQGHADAVSFGRHYIANPDLPEKFRQGIQPKPFDNETLYTAGSHGYIDY